MFLTIANLVLTLIVLAVVLVRIIGVGEIRRIAAR